jgi:hypothetical protein
MTPTLMHINVEFIILKAPANMKHVQTIDKLKTNFCRNSLKFQNTE